MHAPLQVLRSSFGEGHSPGAQTDAQADTSYVVQQQQQQQQNKNCAKHQ
jgi:hypothetical protein